MSATGNLFLVPYCQINHRCFKIANREQVNSFWLLFNYIGVLTISSDYYLLDIKHIIRHLISQKSKVLCLWVMNIFGADNIRLPGTGN